MKSLSDQFLDWAERQPPEAEYDFHSVEDGANGCAVTRFMHESGIPEGSVMQHWSKLHDAVGSAAGTRPYTFGALASRLRA